MEKTKNVLLTKVPYSLWKSIKINALENDTTVRDWCIEALTNKLESSSSSSVSQSTSSKSTKQ